MHNNTTPYVWKFDHHAVKIATNNNRKIKEAMWKAKNSTDWWYLDPETFREIYESFNKNTEKELNNSLNTRTAVLHRIKNNDIVLAEYPLSPLKKQEIKPIWQA